MARHQHPFDGTVTDLAEKVGVCRAHLSTILAQGTCKNPDLAKRIEAATNGAIRAACLLGLEPHPRHQDTPGEGEALAGVA